MTNGCAELALTSHAMTDSPSHDTKNISQRRTLAIALLTLVIFSCGALVGFSIGRGGAAFPAVFQNVEKDSPSFGMVQDVWETLQKEYYVQPLKQTEAVYGAVRGLVGSVNDPYTSFFTPQEAKLFQDEISGSFEGIGTEIGIKNGKLVIIAPLPDSPAEKAGLASGDQILSIDGKSTEGFLLDIAVQTIRGAKGTDVKLVVVKEGATEPKELTITRDAITVSSVKFSMRSDGIGVMTLSHFGPQTKKESTAAANAFLVQHGKGLIVDLRNNPGGYLDGAVDVTALFVDSGTLVVSEKYADGRVIRHLTKGGGTLKGIATAVLVDEGTASAAEIVAGALQDHRKATVIGEKTFGKGSVQQLQELSDGSNLKITVAHWFTPNDRTIQDTGIEPDEVVPLTSDDHANDRDPQMEAAMKALETVAAP